MLLPHVLLWEGADRQADRALSCVGRQIQIQNFQILAPLRTLAAMILAALLMKTSRALCHSKRTGCNSPAVFSSRF